ncbi:hypothetical protein BDAP_002035 [Binucleata daphniae]
MIVKRVCTIGKKWKKIAQNFDGRTPNNIKSRWNKFLKFEVIKNPYMLDFYTKKEVEAGMGLLNFWKASYTDDK